MITGAHLPVHTMTLKNRLEVAERTLEIRFEKPPNMTFKPGQYMDLSVIDPIETDDSGNTRSLSINSSPEDPDLVFATRLRHSAFKRNLESMPLGSELRVEGPFGDFTLHQNTKRPAVLLAGGIGVTPFRSMVRRSIHERYPHRIFLFYANRRPEDAPFLDEFRDLQKANPLFSFIPTMTKVAGSSKRWQGETGYIRFELLTKHLGVVRLKADEPTRPIFYIAGPPEMVGGLRSMLNHAHVEDDDIRMEEFAGY